VLEITQNLVRKAYEVEDKALSSYLNAMRILRLYGMELEHFESIVKKVLIDTLIHKEFMSTLLRTYEEVAKKEKEILKEVEELKPSAVEKSLIVKVLKEHLTIESEMIELYRELAKTIQHQVFRDLAEALARNEEEHHKIIKDLIGRYEESS
jgi:rubrerythrin